MKSKKFLSLLLALAMVFSMSVSVFANDGDDDNANDNGWNFEATATVTIPAIDVTVDASAGTDLIINPMGFTVNISDGSPAGAGDTTGVTNRKIVSPVYPIENNSPMKLDVNVSGVLSAVTLPANSTATIPVMSISATAPIAAEDTKNSVFIYAQFGEVEEEGTSGIYKFTTASAVTDATVYTAPQDGATTFKQLALTTKAPAKPVNVGTVAKATSTGSGQTATVTPGLYGFEFRGDCNPNATKDWSNAEGENITVTLIFSFKPSASQT